MADAAEETVEWVKETVRWAESQFYATVGEIVALVVTICIAIAAVAAAFRSNRIARESAERQLRAYVYPTKPRIVLHNDGFAKAVVRLKNTGQTPAKQLTGWVSIAVAHNPLGDTILSDPVNLDQRSRTEIPAGEELMIDTALREPTSPTDQAIIADANGAIYVYGCIEYYDVFDKMRTTTFRFLYSGVWGGTRGLSVCPEGNESD